MIGDSLTLSQGPTLHNQIKQSGALFVQASKRKTMVNTSNPPPEWGRFVTTQNDARVSVSRLYTSVVMVVCLGRFKQRQLKNGGCLFELETQFDPLVSFDVLQRMFDSSVLSNESR